ncbi:ATPase [Fusarium oxysporum f. sp. lycopersici MN25]|nr:ATPase [Fusarium oxysporum f. sp. lycopersici MN25]
MPSDIISSEKEKPAPVTEKAISSRDSINTLTPNMGKGDNGPGNEEDHIQEEMVQLARRWTTRSQGAGAPESLFPLPEDGPLNPNSGQFNAKAWAKAFYKARKEALEGNPPKTTGVAFQNLNVYGFGTDTDFQKSVGNIFLDAITLAKRVINKKQERVDILYDLEGVVHSGEMLCVLGPPGSGCSTFLKTIAGDTHGFHVQDGGSSTINYQGIHPKKMKTAFRGEAIYTAEVDHHFPQLIVGDTLYFAAAARCLRTIPRRVTRKEYIEHLRDVTMAIFGISYTKNTRVGDDFLRGADILGCTLYVAIYQAPQAAYDLFEKVLILYKGRQIFFGKASRAQRYFEELRFICPDQQTTADFLTSMTSPQERIIRPG